MVHDIARDWARRWAVPSSRDRWQCTPHGFVRAEICATALPYPLRWKAVYCWIRRRECRGEKSKCSPEYGVIGGSLALVPIILSVGFVLQVFEIGSRIPLTWRLITYDYDWFSTTFRSFVGRCFRNSLWFQLHVLYMVRWEANILYKNSRNA